MQEDQELHFVCGIGIEHVKNGGRIEYLQLFGRGSRTQIHEAMIRAWERPATQPLCAASFATIWPFANAMRHSEKTGFEDSKGYVTISCPDGWVQFRLS